MLVMVMMMMVVLPSSFLLPFLCRSFATVVVVSVRVYRVPVNVKQHALDKKYQQIPRQRERESSRIPSRRNLHLLLVLHQHAAGVPRGGDVLCADVVNLDMGNIVISDGDLIRNQVSSDGRVYPLGYDKFASKQKKKQQQ